MMIHLYEKTEIISNKVREKLTYNILGLILDQVTSYYFGSTIGCGVRKIS